LGVKQTWDDQDKNPVEVVLTIAHMWVGGWKEPQVINWYLLNNNANGTGAPTTMAANEDGSWFIIVGSW